MSRSDMFSTRFTSATWNGKETFTCGSRNNELTNKLDIGDWTFSWSKCKRFLDCKYGEFEGIVVSILGRTYVTRYGAGPDKDWVIDNGELDALLVSLTGCELYRWRS